MTRTVLWTLRPPSVGSAKPGSFNTGCSDFDCPKRVEVASIGWPGRQRGHITIASAVASGPC